MKKMLTNTQAAYLAALIDGEGSLECQKQNQKRGKTPRYVCRLSFTMVTHLTLDEISSWLNIKKPKKYKTNDPKRSDRYRLHIPKVMLFNILNECRPYIIDKQNQLVYMFKMEALRKRLSPSRHHFGNPKLMPMPQEWEKLADKIYKKFRSLKSNKRPGNCRPRQLATLYATGIHTG